MSDAAASTRARPSLPRGLYGMVDLPADARASSAIALARALLDGGAAVLQLRMKHAEAGDLLACARALRPLTAAAGALLVVNDRLDVALAAGADGVHLGQDDLPVAAARPLAPSLLVGVSTHGLAQARAAEAGGADYIGFGPLFATTSKANPDPVVGLDGLRECCATVSIPVIAIGGIGFGTLPDVVAAGAHGAAIISAVNRSGDVAGAARRVTEAFSRR